MRSRLPSRLQLLGLLAALALAAALGAGLNWWARDSTAVPKADATPPRAGEVWSGAYSYATEGQESISALGGARHVYPEETFLSARQGGCGVVLRWQALGGGDERWTEWEYCRDDHHPAGWRLAGFTEHHRFFGQASERSYRCEPSTGFLRLDGKLLFRSLCTGNGTTYTLTEEALGEETLEIGGVEVKATKVHAEVIVAGETRGGAAKDYWMTAEGLVVKRRERNETMTDSPVGEVRYRESFEVVLTALEPRP